MTTHSSRCSLPLTIVRHPAYQGEAVAAPRGAQSVLELQGSGRQCKPNRDDWISIRRWHARPCRVPELV